MFAAPEIKNPAVCFKWHEAPGKRERRSTCPACLEAGLPHLVLQLLVLCRDGLANGNKASHGHVHRLAHPVYGCQGAL